MGQPAARPRIETVTAHHTAADDAVTAARMSAAEVQRLPAAVAALKAQVTGLGERVARSDVAQSTVAERVEALAAEMARLGRLPDSLGGLRADLTGLLEKVESRMRGDMGQQLAGRGQALAQAIGRLPEVEGRLASLEEFPRADVPARLEALEARRDKDETRVQDVEDRIHALETRPPRMAAQTESRLNHLAEEVASLGREVAGWQSRLETAGETARAAEAVVKAVRAEADDLRRDHRAHAEAVRGVLDAEPDLRAPNIHGACLNKRIILRGIVAHPVQKVKAGLIALRHGDTSKVRNRLVVMD